MIGVLERVEREIGRHPVAGTQRDALVEAEEPQTERALPGDLERAAARRRMHLDVRVADLVPVEDDPGPVLLPRPLGEAVLRRDGRGTRVLEVAPGAAGERDREAGDERAGGAPHALSLRRAAGSRRQ